MPHECTQSRLDGTWANILRTDHDRKCPRINLFLQKINLMDKIQVPGRVCPFFEALLKPSKLKPLLSFWAGDNGIVAVRPMTSSGVVRLD